ncbi:conserved protein of unknown function [Ruminococcaceae bacterium BL-6]|nr:conserved protein of unknown function [Ruminococcaceae bacterium BL-6]
MPDEKELTPAQKQQKQLEYVMRLNYQRIAKSIVQDLQNNRKESVLFQKYDKEKMVKFLANPQQYEKQIRSMSRFLYDNSPQYKRLCKYMAGIPTLDYIIAPYNIPKNYNKNSFLVNYNKIVNLLERMNLKHEFNKIFTTCWYEDIFAGLYTETEDSFSIVKINPDYVQISSVNDGCLTYSLDMSYFDTRQYLLGSYGDTLKQMYYSYAGYTPILSNGKRGKKIKGNPNLRWQEPPNQICLKINEDQILYSSPPFASVFPDILNLEDYKQISKTGEFLDHYKLIAEKIPLNDDGTFQMDEEICDKYYQQTCDNVSSSIGVILTPMDIEPISFTNTVASEHDAVNNAESAVYSSAGSSQMLFGGGDKSSSAILELSTKNDESLAFGLVRQVERWINRYIKQLNLPYSFKAKFLDTSIFNRDKMVDMYFKAAQGGVPCKMALSATLGYSPSDTINMGILENDVLKLTDNAFSKVLLSSNTQSGNDQGGRPTNKSEGKSLTESGEQTQEDDENSSK